MSNSKYRTRREYTTDIGQADNSEEWTISNKNNAHKLWYLVRNTMDWTSLLFSVLINQFLSHQWRNTAAGLCSRVKNVTSKYRLKKYHANVFAREAIDFSLEKSSLSFIQIRSKDYCDYIKNRKHHVCWSQIFWRLFVFNKNIYDR